MADLQKIKDDLKNLKPEERVEIKVYLASLESVKKDLTETLELTPTDDDKAFVEKYKYDADVKWNTIKFTQNYREIGGVKFPRRVAQYQDVQDVPGLELGKNIIIKEDNVYFNYDAVEILKKAGYKIPTELQFQQAAIDTGHGRSMENLQEFLDYPMLGVVSPEGELKAKAEIFRTRASEGQTYNDERSALSFRINSDNTISTSKGSNFYPVLFLGE